MSRSREQNVPLLLWISTAILAHIASGGGAEQIARVLEDRSDLQLFARTIAGRLRPPPGIEVSFENVPPETPAEPAPPPPNTPRADRPDKPEPKKPEQKKPEKVEPKKIALPAMTATSQPPPPPPPTDHRIAVKQHAAPDQEDNPTAHFLGDDANHVKEESVAQITAHDQDDPEPTPGGHHTGPQGKPGNGEKEKVGDSDDHAGDPTHAPGENAQAPDTEHAQKGVISKNSGQANSAPGVRPDPKMAGTKEPAPKTSPAPAAPAAGGAGPAAPEVVAQENGEYHLDPARPGDQGQSANSGDGHARLPPAPVPSSPIGMLGLGGTPTPSGINLNMTPQSVVAIVGEDKLTKERMADGERRRSQHRGSWESSNFERWRAAIENYVSSVKPGNQTALNTARSPFATYLNAIHNRIHPIFADDFLMGALEGLPSNNPLNDPTLVTRLEIVLNRDDGHIVRMGVVRTSGITAFDIAALDSVQRASPFGKPPKAIVSTDGNVYLHWEFHRDPVFACSTMNARPFMLNVPPPAEPAEPKPSTPPIPGIDPREQQAPPSQGSRQGFVAPDPGFRRSRKSHAG